VSDWRIAGDIRMRLEPGTVIPPGGTIHLVADRVAFRGRAAPPTGGQGLYVQGNWTGVLVNLASLSLTDADGNAVPQ